VPRGETADIVNDVFPEAAIEPKNIASIVAWLKARLSGEINETKEATRSVDIDDYSRTAQTARLVELLNKLVLNRQTTRRAIR
jgi:hypothetical protein